MERLRQTHTNISDLFSRLAVEKASLDSALQRCAERDVQDRQLLSAVSKFVERQRRVEDDVRGLLDRQSESDEVLAEGIGRLFKEKRERDQGLRKDIEGLFEESVRGAQEIERLLRRFDVAKSPAQDSENQGSVEPVFEQCPRPVSVSLVSSPSSSFSGLSNPFANSLASPTLQSFEPVNNVSVSLIPLGTPRLPPASLSPSPSPDILETKPELQEWDFFDYEDGVVWGSESEPRIKPPTLFTKYDQSDVATPTYALPPESVDDGVTIPIPEWIVGTGDNVREVKVRGIRVLKDGNVELSVRMIDSRTKPNALEELTQNLTNYHRGTIHRLNERDISSGQCSAKFVSVKSSHGSAWHRGQILQVVDHNFVPFHEILFVDSGFHEFVDLANIRPLPTLFRFLPQQARIARLSFVKFHVPRSQYFAESLETLRKACTGRTLVAKLDHMDHSHYCDYSSMPLSMMYLRLMEPGVNSDDGSMSINGQLLRDGLVMINTTLCRSSKAYQSAPHELANAAMRARNEGVGMYWRQKAVEGDSESQGEVS